MSKSSELIQELRDLSKVIERASMRDWYTIQDAPNRLKLIADEFDSHTHEHNNLRAAYNQLREEASRNLELYEARLAEITELKAKRAVVPTEYLPRVKQVIRQGLSILGQPRGVKHGAEADEWLTNLYKP